MLASSTIQIMAILMVVGTLVGIASFSRRSRVIGGRHPGIRADDSPPPAVQGLWSVINLLLIAYPIAVAAVPDLAYASSPRFMFQGDSFVQVLGFVVWGFGGALTVWSGRALGRFMVIEIAVARDHELIQEGPYARMRHPAYLGVVLLFAGMTLLFLSYVLLAVTVLAALIAIYRAGKEERLLSSARGFGDAYRAYMARTGRFLPKLGK